MNAPDGRTCLPRRPGWPSKRPFWLNLTRGTAPLFYGYRRWGPNWRWVEGFTPGSALGFRADVDARGNRFNPNSVVYNHTGEGGLLSFRAIDNATYYSLTGDRQGSWDKNWLSASPTPDERVFERFTRRLLAFRHAHPALRPRRPWPGTDGNGNGLEAARWFTPRGQPADPGYLTNPAHHAVALRLDGSELGEADSLLVAVNGWWGAVDFTLPWPGTGRQWRLVGDTCASTEGLEQLAAPGAERPVGPALSLCGRGLALLVGR
jgi:hypothetical protein